MDRTAQLDERVVTRNLNTGNLVRTDQLSQLVNEKHAALQQLRELAVRQLALAEQPDPKGLISLLAVKQRLLDQLTKIESDLNPFRAEDPEERVWRSPQQRADCAEVSQACQALLREVMELDRQAAENLNARKQQNKVQIDAAHQAASARTAYAASEVAPRQRIDLSSQS